MYVGPRELKSEGEGILKEEELQKKVKIVSITVKDELGKIYIRQVNRQI